MESPANPTTAAPPPKPTFRLDPRFMLVGFVRLLSLVFLASGLHNWAILLGPLAPGGDYLSLPMTMVVAVGYFAVVDLVAAVGLWLLASWGTVVWLIAALTETVLHTVFRDDFGLDVPLIAFHGVTVVVYAVLTYVFERSRDR